MNAKGILIIVALIVLAAVSIGPVSANIATGEETGSAVLYESKYTAPSVAPKDINQVTGILQVHATPSYISTAGYTPAFALRNTIALNRPAKEFSMLPDGTFEDRFIPGEFTLQYRYCSVPVTIRAGVTTVVALSDCDR